MGEGKGIGAPVMSVCDRLTFGGEASPGVDFIGRGNVWVDPFSPGAEGLVRYVVYKALTETGAGQLDIVSYDSELSGALAPFSPLSSSEVGGMEYLLNADQLKHKLTFLRQQVQSVQNMIQGRADSLLEYRTSTQRAFEGYTLVVLSLDMGIIPDDLRNDIVRLMRRGPESGISFLIVSTTVITVDGGNNGQGMSLEVHDLAPNTAVLEADGGTVKVDGGASYPFSPIPRERLVEDVASLADGMIHASLPTVRFDEIEDLRRIWTKSSVDGLTFSLGKYGTDDIEVTIGDHIGQRHNILVTGAVGQGKSNLISVIIHSLCLNYAPSELQLYLLDFKEGVTFKPFSNIGHEDWLPHVKALGLDADVGFGISVLESLFGEYKERMQLMKDNDCRSIQELRERHPEIVMPRIVTVIDEFQLMLGDDNQTGQRVTALLEKSIRLFRAAGIHFILSSQSLAGNTVFAQKKEPILSQVPVRIALKNSITESQNTLAPNNPAAAFLRSHEAIVNVDYGAVTQNKRTTIAFADEGYLVPVRRRMWELWMQKDPDAQPPYVFESERHARFTDAIGASLDNRGQGTVRAVIGNRISVNGELLTLPFAAEPGRNLAIIGTPDDDCDHALGMLEAAAMSVMLQAPATTRVYLCDLAGTGAFEPNGSLFIRMMTSFMKETSVVEPPELEGLLKGLTDEEGDTPAYVFAYGLDRWVYARTPYGGSAIQKFAESGPAGNKHFVGYWAKETSFKTQATMASADPFNSKVFLRIDERAVQSLAGPYVKWSATRNRALAYDAVEFSEPITFVPYAPIGQAELQKLMSYRSSRKGQA